jgi:glycosyltransferase involved in cell wall biosynthesis
MNDRILFVTHTPEFGGAEKHLIDLVGRMDERVDCQILCLGRDFFSEPLRGRRNVRVATAPAITDWRFAKYWRLFVRFQPSVIVLVKGIFDQYPFSAYVAARLAGNRRLVVIEHLIADPAPAEVEGQGLAGGFRRLFGWRIRHMATKRWQGWLADTTICVSEAVRRRLVEEYKYPAARTITVRNGIDCRRYQPREHSLDIPTSEPSKGAPVTIICAARLSSAKRIDVLLEALAMLRADSVPWRCRILGAGPLEAELRVRASQLGLSELVKFVGYVEDVRPHLSQADLFVLSSDKEGLPLALLEAMACGLPAIVTEVGGTGEVVVQNETGLLVRRGDVEGLAKGIRQLLGNAGARERMGLAARRRIHEYFEIEQAMQRLQSVIVA